MAEACGRDRWSHTSAILALIANVNRDPRKVRAFRPADFNPYMATGNREQAVEIADLGVLKDAFTYLKT